MIHEHVHCQLPQATPCKMAFVGEAPADEETVEGRPFVGPSGHLYDKLLRVNGILREDCLTTNVVDVQAPDNDVDKLLVRSCDLPKDPTAYCLNAVRPGRYLPVHLLFQLERLAAEICACQPNIVVAMGGLAAWAFWDASFPLKDGRGAVWAAKALVPGIKVLATYHPAFTFHNPQVFPLIAQDFAKAKTESRSSEVVYDEREVVIEPTLDEVERFKDAVLSLDDGSQNSAIPILAVDIETVPRAHQIKCVGFALAPRYSIVIPFVDFRAVSKSYWDTPAAEVSAWEMVKAICESPIPKVMQNGLYDLRYFYDHGITVKNYLHDTKLAQHALFPELPKDLGSLGAAYTNERPWKLWRGLRDGRKREE